MSTQASPLTLTESNQLSLYRQILVALDSSDHANAGMDVTLQLAALTEGASITGVHAYAAKLHDVRFRQMEGGLPEQFREEQELERQRDVHDDLISRGLSIITDSYLDQADTNCQQAGIPFNRCSLEGKNYRALTEETNSGRYDLLVMGALGLGAVETSRLGTVCQRVARRNEIDTLVIKQPQRALTEGPIVVAVDGSTRSYGGLLTALQLAKHWQVPLKVVAVFDPYFHYVAFNRIAGVLSEEAGKVFRFQEQEQLHEEIIDSGLAKIYQGHLDVAQAIARDHHIEIDPVLLDGKPHDAISRYVESVNPSLLVIGKLGIHADDALDIGGNAEYLLQDVPCAVLLSQRQHQPHLDLVADTTTSWTHEAEGAMDGIPGFVRNMARTAILRHAQERGHTVITEKIVKDATSALCPSHAKQAIEEIVAAHDAGELNAGPGSEPGFEKMNWTSEAETLLDRTEDASVRSNLRKRAEKKARAENASIVDAIHIEPFTGNTASVGTGIGTDIGTESVSQPSPSEAKNSANDATESLHWQTAALARLMRVPEGFMRDSVYNNIEDHARQQGIKEITLELTESLLEKSSQEMVAAMKNGVKQNQAPSDTKSESPSASTGKCPFAAQEKPVAPADNKKDDINWSSQAMERLAQIPLGMSRDMTRKAVENIAQNQGIDRIEQSFLDDVLDTFKSGSANTTETLPWETKARESIQRAPDMVRGMLIKEIESWALRNDLPGVTETAVEAVKTTWQQRGYFHLAPDDPRSGDK